MPDSSSALHTVRSTAELRQALSSATPGDVIELGPGEYQGPILIDKPVTLRGLGRKTVFWRRTGPVFWLQTPDVKLDKVHIERTVYAEGPRIVHNQGCAAKGLESMVIDAEALINLGQLSPGLSVSLPLELETSARAEINTAGLYGARVAPAVLETAGKHLVWLTLEGTALARGELILGEIAIRETQGGATRNLWVSGTVLDAPIESNRVLCFAMKTTRLYPGANGLALGAALGAIKVDNPAAHSVYIQSDSSGCSLFPAREVPLTVNNTPVIRWTRVPLYEKDTITIGDTVLTVSAGDSPPILVETNSLTFADFDENFPEAVNLTVQNGKTAWKGRVMATVPWLDVIPTGDVRIPPNRGNTWAIQLSSGALALPNGVQQVNGGVLVVGSNHVMSVDINASIRRPDVALQIAGLDAGAVEWGWSPEYTVSLTIGNLGRGIWSGIVTSNVPWLEVSTEMPLTCDPWSEVVVNLKFIPKWESLVVGMVEIPDAIRVRGFERPISARVEVNPALGHLVPITELISFDEVERNAPLPDAILTVRNDGAAPWTGTLRAANGWVRLKPETVAVAPGTTAEIEVSLLDVPADVVLDTPILIDEIQFESSGEPVSPISVQMTLVELPPYIMANPVSFPPFVRGDPPPEANLRIQNMGPGRWRGEITTTLSWLIVPERVFLCEPEDMLDIVIAINSAALEDLRTGFSRWDGALYITGGREPISAGVEIDLREAVSELMLDTPLLNFGQVDGATLTLPSETIRVVNASPTPWKGSIEVCVPWLELPPQFDLEVPGMNTAEFAIPLAESARWLQPGVIVEDRALLLSGADQQLPIRAMLVLHEWTPALSITPKNLLFSETTSQNLTLMNTGKRTWTVQISAASWLTVTPSEITLNAGEEQKITITPSNAEPISDSRGIVIVAPGREYEIPIEIK